MKDLGTDDLNHSGSSLLVHLIGTSNLLKEWGNPPPLCRAGLFHSIYGTQYFQTSSASTENRQMIKKLIGNTSEKLVYLFCVCDRHSFYNPKNKSGKYYVYNSAEEEKIEISEEGIKALLEIEAANAIEQLPRIAEHVSIERRLTTIQNLLNVKEMLTPSASGSLFQALHLLQKPGPN